MADVGLRVGIEGSQEAQKAIEEITKVIVQELGAEIQRQEAIGKTTSALDAQAASTIELKDEGLSLAEVQENLNKLAAEHQQKLSDANREQKKYDEQTEELKRHTQQLVRNFEEQNQEVKNAQRGFSNLTGEIGRTVMQYAAATVGIAAVVSTVKESLSAGREAELTFIKLGAVLEATGSSAGFTASQLGDLSEKLAQGTRFDNTGIQQAMTILLTFGGVQGEVFESALRHAQNLSEMYGIGLPQAARTMGQALSDPGQGLGQLRRYIGPLNDDLKDLIKNLDVTGRTAEARQEIIKLLDSKFKDFAVTIGTSTPAAFDRAGLAWKNLLEVLGKSENANATFTFWEDRFRNLAGFIENWAEIRRGMEIDALNSIVNSGNSTEQSRANALKRLAEMEAQARKKEADEKQRARDAELAAAVKAWEEEEAARKRANEEKEKEGKKTREKEERERQAQILRLFELNELEVKAGKMSLESREILLESFLAEEKKGTDIHIRLSKLLAQTQDELMKQAETRQERALAMMDLDIARGQKSYEQKVIMLDEWISHEQAGTAKWIELMTLRQRTLDDIKQRDDKRAREQEKRDEDHARDIKRQADEEIMAIRRAVASSNEKLAALDKLALKYYNMEKAGVDAYEAVQKAIRNTETEEERRAKRVQNIMESMRLNVSNLSTEEEKRFRRIVSVLDGIGVDIVSIFGSIESSWGSSIKGMMDGSMSFSEGIKSMWKGIVDAIIEEIARMVARWLAAQAVMGFFQLAGFALSVATGNPAGAVTAGAFSAGGGFASGGDLVVTRPTAILAGEAGAERISVTPLSGGASSRPAVVNVFQGPNVMDQFSLRRFVRDQQRIMRSEIARRG